MNELTDLAQKPPYHPAGRVISKARNISARLPSHLIEPYLQLKEEGVTPSELIKCSLELMFRMLDEAQHHECVHEEVDYLHRIRCDYIKKKKNRAAIEKQELKEKVELAKQQLREALSGLKKLDEETHSES